MFAVCNRKEELEQRKKAESNVAGDSDILKMINATSISKSPSPPFNSVGEGMCFQLRKHHRYVFAMPIFLYHLPLSVFFYRLLLLVVGKHLC